MRWVAPMLALVALLPLAGCIDEAEAPVLRLEPSETSPEARAQHEFWMVHVQGRETRERVFGITESLRMCSIVFSHELDALNRTLAYDANWSPIDRNGTRFVLAFDHFESWGSCPLAYRLVSNESAEIRMGRAGNHTFDVRDDGAILYDGQEIPLGQRGLVAYTTYERDGATLWRIHGEFTVENLGTWPRSGLRPR